MHMVWFGWNLQYFSGGNRTSVIDAASVTMTITPPNAAAKFVDADIAPKRMKARTLMAVRRCDSAIVDGSFMKIVS